LITGNRQIEANMSVVYSILNGGDAIVGEEKTTGEVAIAA